MQMSSPPLFRIEKPRNLGMVSFVGKQITPILQQRPKVGEAGLERVHQIDI